jgi:hypothetical protein
MPDAKITKKIAHEEAHGSMNICVGHFLSIEKCFVLKKEEVLKYLH